MPISLTQIQRTTAADTSSAMRIPRVVRNFAWIGAALTLCALVFAAAMRLRAAGFDCAPWPDCYRAATFDTAPLIVAVRLAHRISAGLVLLCAIVIALACFGTQASPRLARTRAALAVAGILLLAGLGRFSGPTAPAFVSLANLLLGLGVAVAFASIAVAATSPRRAPAATDRVTAIALMFMTISGSIASTHRPSEECSHSWLCGTLSDPGSFTTWIASGHRILGVLSVVWLLAWALRSYRAGAERGWVLLLCTAGLALLGFGILQATGAGAPSIALMHHAATGLALVAAVGCSRRNPPSSHPTGSKMPVDRIAAAPPHDGHDTERTSP